jgi:hypothetical protein
MGLRIHPWPPAAGAGSPPAGRRPLIAKERLYLTADGKRVVKEGDPAANSLLVGKGCEVPRELAEKHGLKRGRLLADAPAPAPEG